MDLTSTGNNGKVEVNFEDPQQGVHALPSVEDIMNMTASGANEGSPVGSIPAAVFQVRALQCIGHARAACCSAYAT